MRDIYTTNEKPCDCKKREASERALNDRLIRLHDRLVVELRKASNEVRLLQQKEEGIRMIRDGLLELEKMGIIITEQELSDTTTNQVG